MGGVVVGDLAEGELQQHDGVVPGQLVVGQRRGVGGVEQHGVGVGDLEEQRRAVMVTATAGRVRGG